MEKLLNQAVLFTKPLEHLGIPLLADELADIICEYIWQHGFQVTHASRISGPELAERDVIRDHYAIYSRASYISDPAELGMGDAARQSFQLAFGKSWDEEVGAGRVMGHPLLLQSKGVDEDGLFELWNAQYAEGRVARVQEGVLVAWLEALDCYCINGFYPAMEKNFYAPSSMIEYFVVEFDPERVSWNTFRHDLLGATDASKAVEGSLRANLYAEYRVEFPARDNFIHGSASPLEGFVERSVHEAHFDELSNPVGRFLAQNGISLNDFLRWKGANSISTIAELFEQVEDRDIAEVLSILESKVAVMKPDYVHATREAV